MCSVIKQRGVLAASLGRDISRSTTQSAGCSLDRHPSPDSVAASLIGAVCVLASRDLGTAETVAHFAEP